MLSKYWGIDIPIPEQKMISAGEEVLIIPHDTLDDILHNSELAIENNVCIHAVQLATNEPRHYAFLCTISDKNGRRAESVGEACDPTLTTEIAQNYPVLMAYKRAFDDAAIKYLGLEGKVYSDQQISSSDSASTTTFEMSAGFGPDDEDDDADADSDGSTDNAAEEHQADKANAANERRPKGRGRSANSEASTSKPAPDFGPDEDDDDDSFADRSSRSQDEPKPRKGKKGRGRIATEADSKPVGAKHSRGSTYGRRNDKPNFEQSGSLGAEEHDNGEVPDYESSAAWDEDLEEEDPSQYHDYDAKFMHPAFDTPLSVREIYAIAPDKVYWAASQMHVYGGPNIALRLTCQNFIKDLEEQEK